jgi:hypothetical protein
MYRGGSQLQDGLDLGGALHWLRYLRQGERAGPPTELGACDLTSFSLRLAGMTASRRHLRPLQMLF